MNLPACSLPCALPPALCPAPCPSFTLPCPALPLCVAASVISRLGGGRAGIERVLYMDSSPDMLARVKVGGQREGGGGGCPIALA